MFAGGAAWFAYQTIKSQREQIREQRQFIAEQSANLALERAELRAVADDRKWAQARQVVMQRAKFDRAGVGFWRVTVHNFSNASVHGVEVRFGSAYLASEVYEWPINEHPRDDGVPGHPYRGERLMTPVHLLGPGRAVLFLSQHWPSVTAHNNRPVVFFTDDSGVRWSLDTYGKLEEAPADGAS